MLSFQKQLRGQNDGQVCPLEDPTRDRWTECCGLSLCLGSQPRASPGLADEG